MRAAILTAKSLRTLGLLDRYEVILIDRNEHHTYTPLLYEVATTSKDTANVVHLHDMVTHPVSRLVAHLPIRFLNAEVKLVDLVEGGVHLKDGTTLAWNYLVLALGAEVNFFGIPGIETYALPLKTFSDAIRIRDAVWNKMSEGAKDVRIAVGGGGPTGVELSGELAAWAGELRDTFPGTRLSLTLIEASPSILYGFDPRVIRSVKNRLARIGVHIMEQARIQSVAAHEAVLANSQKIPFDIFIWAGGIRAPQIFGTMPIKTEERGHIAVLGEMECLPQRPTLKLHANIYALGDCICFYDPLTQKPIPSVARAALSQANVVAHNVIEDIKAEENPRYKPFRRIYRPMEYPYIIPVGGKYAVSKLGPLVVSGLFGWVLKELVELNYLFSIMPLSYAFQTWFRGFVTFIKNDRLG